jgi:uncharacterized membrane protein YhaH (DUF805 family)
MISRLWRFLFSALLLGSWLFLFHGGRISQRAYILSSLVLGFIPFIVYNFGEWTPIRLANGTELSTMDPPTYLWSILVVCLWSITALCSKRLHDFGEAGWHSIQPWSWILAALWVGENVSNRFGEPASILEELREAWKATE